MTSFAYDSYIPDVFAGNIDDGDTYFVMLVAAGYTPNMATHTKRSDVTNEITGTGYTAGGQAVVPTFTKDTTNHKLVVTFPAVTWSGATFTGRRAVYYKRRGGAASADELVCVDDFGADVVAAGVPFILAATTLNVGTPV